MNGRLGAGILVAAPLGDEARGTLGSWGRPYRAVERGRNLNTTDAGSCAFFLVSGWAARYLMLPDGSRKIVGILLPGDPINLHSWRVSKLDHAVLALTDAQVAVVPRERVEHACDALADLRSALSAASVKELAILRKWYSLAGRTPALKAVAHLLCELDHRQRQLGVEEGRITFPIKQEEIADALGLTAVHVNRTLKELREMGLAKGARPLTISDRAGLMKTAKFDPAYLEPN